MNKKICILGAGGHTRSIINLIEASGLEITGIYDSTYDPESPEMINGYAIAGNPSQIPAYPVVLSIGENNKRSQWYRELSSKVYEETLVHPDAIIESNAKLGNANQVFAKAYINSNCRIGDNNIINTGSIIEHEVNIGDHNHIAVGAIVCGRAKIGNHCLIGAGATIIDKIKIGDNVIIGANAVIINDIPEAGTYAGNPARRVK